MKTVKTFFFIVFLIRMMPVDAQLTMQKRNDGILITEDNEKVLFYQIEPKSTDGKFKRNNYIHPLWSLSGDILTEDSPDDHLHHRGIFWAWHQVWIGDKRIGDPWELKDFDQEVVEIEFFKNSEGTVLLNTEVDWLSSKWKRNGRKVPYIKEHAEIKVYPNKGKYRRIDFKLSFLALEENLKIGGSEDAKGYGGFSVRMKLPEDVSFTGKNGKVSPEVTAVKSEDYMCIKGSFGAYSKEAGIVIIDHKMNPGYPQPWILRKKNSMQNAVWPGKEPITLSTQKPTVLKYSLLIVDGGITNRKIEKITREIVL